MTKHLACSKMWTDINVNVPTKEIKNCCKREPQMLSPDEITSYGRNVFVKNRELLEDKKYFIENTPTRLVFGKTGTNGKIENGHRLHLIV